MALTLASYIIGTHARFFRNGDAFTVPGAGTCGRDAKPGATDPAWINVGVIEEASDVIEPGEAHEVWAPSPGALVLKDILRTKAKINFKFTVGELGPFAIEVLYRTLVLSAGTEQFNPMEGIPKKGWLKLQRYDSENTLRIVLDAWVELSISGEVAMGGQDIVKPAFEAVMLYSQYNTGQLS